MSFASYHIITGASSRRRRASTGCRTLRLTLLDRWMMLPAVVGATSRIWKSGAKHTSGSAEPLASACSGAAASRGSERDAGPVRGVVARPCWSVAVQGGSPRRSGWRGRGEQLASCAILAVADRPPPRRRSDHGGSSSRGGRWGPAEAAAGEGVVAMRLMCPKRVSRERRPAFGNPLVTDGGGSGDKK